MGHLQEFSYQFIAKISKNSWIYPNKKQKNPNIFVEKWQKLSKRKHYSLLGIFFEFNLLNNILAL
jgi:hypothetical protein